MPKSELVASILEKDQAINTMVSGLYNETFLKKRFNRPIKELLEISSSGLTFILED